MTTKLYTAAEARRIDKEASKDAELGGRITRGRPFERAIQFNDETLVWGYWWGNSFCPIDIDSEELLKEQWMPLTAFLNAERSEKPEPSPEQPWSDKSQSELKIEHLQKELVEATQNYHEILADHGELTQKFDELKEKQRSMRFVLLDAIVASMHTDDTHRMSSAEATVSLRKYKADL